MKKQLTFSVTLCLTLISFGLNAQKKTPVKTAKPKTEVTAPKTKTSKPSKKETMDWIGSKMKDNLAGKLGDYRHFVSYNDGLFVYKKEVKINQWYYTTIDLSKVTGMNSTYSNDFYITGKKVLQTALEGSQYAEYSDNISISGPNYADYSEPFNFTPDQALVERLKVAFATLIEYNETKKSSDEAF